MYDDINSDVSLPFFWTDDLSIGENKILKLSIINGLLICVFNSRVHFIKLGKPEFDANV